MPVSLKIPRQIGGSFKGTVTHQIPTAREEIESIQTPQYKILDELGSENQKIRKDDRMMYLEAKQQFLHCQALLHDIKMSQFGPGTEFRGLCQTCDRGLCIVITFSCFASTI